MTPHELRPRKERAMENIAKAAPLCIKIRIDHSMKGEPRIIIFGTQDDFNSGKMRQLACVTNAAPAMLEALKAGIDWMENWHLHGGLDEQIKTTLGNVIARYKRAITQAEGKE